MPIYEYECPNCGVFELMRRITGGPIKHCPECKAKVERIVSRTSFVLKGSGWYATDYARSPAPSTSGPTSGAEAASSSNGTTQASPATGSDAGASSSKKADADAPKSPAAKAAD